MSEPFFKFGEQIVHAEPSWYQHWKSPYFTQHHETFRKKVRDFVDAELRPNVSEWEETVVTTGKEAPIHDIMQKAVAAGIFMPMYSAELGGTPPQGGWDYFMDLVWNDELGRCGCGGINAIFGIPTMALPPLIKSGNPHALEAAKQVISGKKVAALAISEPYAGSDVANIRTSAKLEGDHYILNGEKKWITLGVFADYFTVAARTGGPGHKGLSFLLVHREWKGVSTKRLKLQGHWTGGTAMVLFNDVKVPTTHLVGKEGTGFKQIVRNFNHERWTIAVGTNRASRELLAESMRYAMKRKTFGKRLLEHQVIRQKIADMAMRIEAGQALIEQVTYQMHRGLPEEFVGGPSALLKVFCTRTLELCVRESSQIFGGSSYVRSGVGCSIERAGREMRASVIPGGSDEILADLSVRQALQLTQRAMMADNSVGGSKL